MTTITEPSIQKMLLSEIGEAAYNPRRRLRPGDNDYEKLKRSIETFGLVDLPVVNLRTAGKGWKDETPTIVGGHQRYYVLRDMGETSADVIVVDLDAADERKLNLALNRIQGDWDLELLSRMQQTMDAADLEIAGFDPGEIDDMRRLDELNRATDFLNPYASPDERASVGAPELKDDHPHRTGVQYFQHELVFTAEQRDVYFNAVRIAKAEQNLDSTMEAVVKICSEYVDRRVGDGSS